MSSLKRVILLSSLCIAVALLGCGGGGGGGGANPVAPYDYLFEFVPSRAIFAGFQ